MLHLDRHATPVPHSLGLLLYAATAAKCVYVDEDFELITFDFVTEPSTHGAFLVPVCKPYKRPIPDQSKA